MNLIEKISFKESIKEFLKAYDLEIKETNKEKFIIKKAGSEYRGIIDIFDSLGLGYSSWGGPYRTLFSYIENKVKINNGMIYFEKETDAEDAVEIMIKIKSGEITSF